MQIQDKMRVLLVLCPSCRGAELEERLQALSLLLANIDKEEREQAYQAFLTKEKEREDMARKTECTEDFNTGYGIGEYAALEGEELDFGEQDALANEMFEKLGGGRGIVTDLTCFSSGLSAGYTTGYMQQSSQTSG